MIASRHINDSEYSWSLKNIISYRQRQCRYFWWQNDPLLPWLKCKLNSVHKEKSRDMFFSRLGIAANNDNFTPLYETNLEGRNPIPNTAFQNGHIKENTLKLLGSGNRVESRLVSFDRPTSCKCVTTQLYIVIAFFHFLLLLLLCLYCPR